MAIQNYAACNFADGAVQMGLTFDDVTLLVGTATRQNLTDFPAVVSITTSTPTRTHAFTVQPNTAPGSIDVSSLNIQMDARQVVTKGSPTPITVYSLPSTITLTFQYPA